MADLHQSFSQTALHVLQAVRKEAADVKECFTRFSFNALLFSGALFGAIVNFQRRVPELGFASVLIIAVLLSVARIGTYKYSTANRSLGYELHLYRTTRIAHNSRHGWKVDLSDIGWEEAMRAWRVVQATIFSHLFYTHIPFVPNFMRGEHRHQHQQWFRPSSMLTDTAEYHAGSYLATMLRILHGVSIGALAPMVFMIWQVSNHPTFPYEKEIAIIVLGLTISVLVSRIVQDTVRRNMLEKGFLSIHACSIMWHAVIVAHFCALEKTFTKNAASGLGYKGYTYYLSQEAVDLKGHAFEIHEWVRTKWT